MINDILKWQAELSDQPKVYWTRWVSGSEPTGNFYQTKEAAQSRKGKRNGIQNAIFANG
jgi:hypothetical protein